MRRLVETALLALLAALTCGCADLQLRRSTLRQASTLTELQYQQVLNNLAMLHFDPFALPSMVALKNGTAQVADTGTALVGLDLGSRTHTLPSFSGTRSVVEQWGTSPMCDDTTLRLLRMAYRQAMGAREVLSEDAANDLVHTLSAQIGTNADISTDSDTLKALVALYRDSAKATPHAQPAADSSVRPSSTIMAQSRAGAGQAGPDQTGDGVPNSPPLPTASPPVPLGEGRRPRQRPPARESAGEQPGDQQPADRGTPLGEGRRPGAGPAVKPGPNQVIDAPGVTPGQFTVLDITKVYGQINTEITSTLDDPVVEFNEDHSAFVPRKSVATGLAKVATGLAKETIRQVNDVQQTLASIPAGWYGVGGKKEVPSNALYVGHFHDTYVWVCPSGSRDLSEFTLAILNLSSLIKDTQVSIVPSGLQFSPALSAGH